MDNSPLNAAHQQHRRAEASMRFRKYDEAIQCHERAADLLRDALKMTLSVKAIESIQLQCDYHIKQKAIAISKKEQHEKWKREIERQKLKMAKQFNTDAYKDNTSNNLQVAIAEKMDEADSIMEILIKRYNAADMDSLESQDSIGRGLVQCHIINENLLISGAKEPKNENMVIEELQILTQQLRKLISQLVTQLEASNQEVASLRSQVAHLEGEQKNILGVKSSPQPSPRLNQHVPLGIITDSNGGSSSPFVFSPCGELSPDTLSDTRELPPLAPLEMPDFDFDTLISQIKIKDDEDDDEDSAY